MIFKNPYFWLGMSLGANIGIAIFVYLMMYLEGSI
jgi:hypothetical protein